jgi:hypothetical protein
VISHVTKWSLSGGVCDQPRDQISSRVGHVSNVD